MKWYEIRAENLRPVSIVIGGRGIGKTYSTISFLMESGEKFIYLRNTDVQLRESASDFGNPFKRWNLDHGRNIEIHPEGKHYIISENEEILGYAAALSTFKNLRGVDLSDIRYVFFDEFIERDKIRFDQFSAFANMYETINRNREVLVLEPGNEYQAEALGINELGELLVRKEDGSVETVFAGEVSVRGIYGYV